MLSRGRYQVRESLGLRSPWSWPAEPANHQASDRSSGTELIARTGKPRDIAAQEPRV